MKVLNNISTEDSNPTSRIGWAGIIFGLYLIGLFAYSIYISDDECLRYFGRRGMGEDCSIDQMTAKIHLGFILCLAFLFSFMGLGNILKWGRRDENTEKRM